MSAVPAPSESSPAVDSGINDAATQWPSEEVAAQYAEAARQHRETRAIRMEQNAPRHGRKMSPVKAPTSVIHGGTS